MTRNKSFWIKLPAIAASFAVGDFIGEKVGTALTHEIRDEIFDIEEEEQQQAQTLSASSIQNNNQEEDDD